MEIGIVGGSIAGCSAAILLKKEGHEVTIFERSDTALVGRGGGIGTTPSLMDQIRKDGLIGEDFAYFQINKMPLVGKDPGFEPYGKTAWSMPVNFQVFQWNELWRNLRKNVSDDDYRSGIQIKAARKTKAGKVELTSEDGEKWTYDLVLFADGYKSMGRQILFPKTTLKYRGYVLWRGLLPESEMIRGCPLSDEILRLSYADHPGHNVVYFIPDYLGVKREGDRVFNWAAYVAVPEDELDELMTDKEGNVREGTMPPGYLSAETENKLKEFMTANIPEYYGEMVSKTMNSYIQVIYTLDLDGYQKNRMCLIGDAGIVVQPFTGSGVFKGYHNVRDLINCMNEYEDLDKALDAWDTMQVDSGKRLLALGEQMEKAFIWEQLDFSTVDEKTTTEWWRASVTFPDHFNYQKG